MGLHGEKCQKVFAEELGCIESPEIRDFVVACFDKCCPKYFWTCPASTSGKYHPKLSLGRGGLIRHTKLAVWWGLELSRSQDSPDHRWSRKKNHRHRGVHQDVVTAALLLHDMRKNGIGLNGAGFPKEGSAKIGGSHGYDLANMLIAEVLGGAITQRWQVLLLYGVASHMGVWTKEEQYIPWEIDDAETQAVALLVHQADYCASRKVDEITESLRVMPL
jgi:hypothetical protein